MKRREKARLELWKCRRHLELDMGRLFLGPHYPAPSSPAPAPLPPPPQDGQGRQGGQGDGQNNPWPPVTPPVPATPVTPATPAGGVAAGAYPLRGDARFAAIERQRRIAAVLNGNSQHLSQLRMLLSS